MTRHVILFLAANPRGHAKLRLEEECAEIQREVSMTRYRDDFQFESRWAVGVDDLIRHLTELAPTVIHISGHGSGSAALMLQDAHGQAQAVSGDALAQIVEAAGRSVRVAVLNACYSIELAEVLRRRVDCVIGMSGAIGDDAARGFAIRFYWALGFRESIGNAVAHGVAALSAKELPDGAFPHCVTREGVGAYTVVLGPPPAREHDGDEPRHPASRRRNVFAGVAVLGIPPALWDSATTANDLPTATAIRDARAAPAARPLEPVRDLSPERRTPEHDARLEDATRSSEATRAVQYQRALLNEFGIAVSDDELIQEAIDNHLYMSSTGMRLEDIARQLEAHGLALHREPQARAFHLAHELGQGHKVLLGVQAHQLWGEHWIRQDICRELGPDHDGNVVLMCSLDTTDAHHPEVVMSDLHTGAVDARYALPEFIEAWRGSGFSLVASSDPCPHDRPEMAHFDYQSGHIPMIGDTPYEVAEAYCTAAAHETSAHAIDDLESQFLCAMDGHDGTGLDRDLGRSAGPKLSRAAPDDLVQGIASYGAPLAMEDMQDGHGEIDHRISEIEIDDDPHGDGHDVPIDSDPFC